MAGKKARTWFEVEAYADDEQVVVLPDGQKFTVRGPIQDVMVVVMGAGTMQQLSAAGMMQKTLEALNLAMRGSGFEGGMVVVPDTLKFARLKPVDSETARLLEQRDTRETVERQARQAQMEAIQDAKRETGAVDLGAPAEPGEA